MRCSIRCRRNVTGFYICDSDTDMMTGNNAGMLPVGVTWGFRDRDVLIAHGARELIDHPEELLTIIDKGV